MNGNCPHVLVSENTWSLAAGAVEGELCWRKWVREGRALGLHRPALLLGLAASSVCLNRTSSFSCCRVTHDELYPLAKVNGFFPFGGGVGGSEYFITVTENGHP